METQLWAKNPTLIYSGIIMNPKSYRKWSQMEVTLTNLGLSAFDTEFAQVIHD